MPRARSPQTYQDGTPYRPAVGLGAPRDAVMDVFKPAHPLFELSVDQPSSERFLHDVLRELKIRYYTHKSRKAYRLAVTGYLRWLGVPPHQATRESVRDYLELLVDGGLSASVVALTLSALRTCFDKLCGADITLGLVTPRRPKRLPVVLTELEVVRLLKAARSIRDKLLLGLMYATGVRVSEVVRLRWGDLDLERGVLLVAGGKGRRARQVVLPKSLEELLGRLAATSKPDKFLFPASERGRHIAIRTAQRAMERAVALAELTKRASCHSLRHSFATHLLEHGTDVRFIQKLLGHAKLETTTLYTKVAVLRSERVRSPLDLLAVSPSTGHLPPSRSSEAALAPALRESARAVGRLVVEMTIAPAADVPTAKVSLVVQGNARARFEGIVLREARPGWIALDIPPLEDWASGLRAVSPAQRERLLSPRFYEYLRVALGRRFLERRMGDIEVQVLTEGEPGGPAEELSGEGAVRGPNGEVIDHGQGAHRARGE